MEYPVGLAGEVGEQVVLQASQVDDSAVDRDLARAGVDHQRADAQAVVCAAGRGPAQDGAEACSKLKVGRWPGDDVVDAGLERSQQIGLVAAGAEDDHRDVRLPVVCVIGVAAADVPKEHEWGVRRVKLPDHHQRWWMPLGEEHGVPGALDMPCWMVVGDQLLDDALSEVEVGLDDEDRRPSGRHSSSLAPCRWRAVAAGSVLTPKSLCRI